MGIKVNKENDGYSERKRDKKRAIAEKKQHKQNPPIERKKGQNAAMVGLQQSEQIWGWLNHITDDNDDETCA